MAVDINPVRHPLPAADLKFRHLPVVVLLLLHRLLGGHHRHLAVAAIARQRIDAHLQVALNVRRIAGMGRGTSDPDNMAARAAVAADHQLDLKESGKRFLDTLLVRVVRVLECFKLVLTSIGM